MRHLFDTRSNLGFAIMRGIPAVAVALAIGAAMFVLMAWAGNRSDQISLERQEGLVKLVLSQMRAQIAHDQESATVWDEAVTNVRSGNTEWIDGNLGNWMHTYFGHDELYVLDPADQPIYAFADEEAADSAAYSAIRLQVQPLVEALRKKMGDGDTSEVNDRILSPGSSAFTLARDRPAIVSVKPIVSDTGEIEQLPGHEYLHVAVRYLDGSLIGDLERDYLFQGLRFSWEATHGVDEAVLALRDGGDRTFGYYIWQPYRPGAAVLAQLTPVMSGGLLLALLTIVALVAAVRSRSLKLQASEARIRHMALHDPLTGLPNRACFNERVDAALDEIAERSVALLYLDLDRFKQVNDTLGHPAGDALICEFGDRLRALVRDVDLVSRIGGDEFTVLLTDVGGRQEVEPLCERIVELVRKPFDLEGNRIFVGVSVGVTMAPQDGSNRIELLRKADVALYHSKSTGRGRYAFFDEGMDDDIKARREIEQELRLALQGEGALVPHFQPIYSASNREITGFEALLRWKHPRRGWVMPDLFIPIAEEAGLIETIGERVLRQACAAAANWPGMTIAVNVSGTELNNPAYSTRVASILMACGLKPERLELEVTETAATHESGSAADNLNALREMGVRIAIDDFGTGFSSLGRLQQLKVDRIKIDKSFVHGFGRTTDDEAIVQAIIELAHAKGLKTTAEGVETANQSDSLVRIGCDHLQGFLYSKAVPRSEIDRLLNVAPPERKVDAA